MPAPDGPTKAVVVPGSTTKERLWSTWPEGTDSTFATDSRDANEISFGLGYEKSTFLNSIFPVVVESVFAPSLFLTIGSKSSTSKTLSKETSEVITSIRTLEIAVSGPYKRANSAVIAKSVPTVKPPLMARCPPIP